MRVRAVIGILTYAIVGMPSTILIAQETKKATNELKPKELVISPARPTTPLFKHRLLPLESTLMPGNAVPVYLRLAHERKNPPAFEFAKNADEVREKSNTEEGRKAARKYVDGWTHFYSYLKIGAHREQCDWGYPTREAGTDIFSILLPDAQDLRQYMRFLQLKAHVEILEGKWGDAIDTLQTGFAMSRHLGSGPFIINGLIGIAGGQVMKEEVEALISAPNSPNLYWALSTLPKPFVSMRHAWDMEYIGATTTFPEIVDDGKPLSADEWARRWQSLKSRWQSTWQQFAGSDPSSDKNFMDVVKLVGIDIRGVPLAKAWFKNRKGLSDAEIDKLPQAQLLLQYTAGYFAELRDESFRHVYLNHQERKSLKRTTDEILKEAKEKEIIPIASTLLPSFEAAASAQDRLDRRIAALRVVEAIRCHAAENNGALPKTLADIKTLPVPIDPITGKPFSYELKDGIASLKAEDARIASAGIYFRIKVRK